MNQPARSLSWLLAILASFASGCEEQPLRMLGTVKVSLAGASAPYYMNVGDDGKSASLCSRGWCYQRFTKFPTSKQLTGNCHLGEDGIDIDVERISSLDNEINAVSVRLLDELLVDADVEVRLGDSIFYSPENEPCRGNSFGLFAFPEEDGKFYDGDVAVFCDRLVSDDGDQIARAEIAITVKDCTLRF